MQVHKPTKSLVLRLRDPAKVTSVIPRSRVVVAEGQQLVQVRHGVDEVRVLNNLGIKAPSPIHYYFDWPMVKGRLPLYPHQRTTAAFIVQNPRCVVLNEMSTGKTVSFISAAEYLMQLGQVKKVLVVGPLSTLHRTWADEVFKTTMHRRVAVLHGTAETRRKLLKNWEKYDYFIINHDGIGVVYDELHKLIRDGHINMVGYDEADALRNAGTTRYKLFRKLVSTPVRLTLMTATPTPTEPSDAWALARLVNPANVPEFFNSFRNQVMRQVTTYKWVPQQDADQKVFAALQPAIRFRTRDCIELPPEVYLDREVELSKAQLAAWEEMRKENVFEQGDTVVTAANAAVKLGKLMQIALGVVYDAEGNPVVLGAPSRVREVCDVIRGSLGKTIVFVPYTAALQYYADEISKEFTVAIVDGSVSANKRAQIFGEFQNMEHPQVLIANPEATSHGLNLAVASTVVWAAPIYKAGVYHQANGRIKRTDQKNHMCIVHLGATKTEWAAYNVLQDRIDTQDGILDMYREFLKGD